MALARFGLELRGGGAISDNGLLIEAQFSRNAKTECEGRHGPRADWSRRGPIRARSRAALDYRTEAKGAARTRLVDVEGLRRRFDASGSIASEIVRNDRKVIAHGRDESSRS